MRKLRDFLKSMSEATAIEPYQCKAKSKRRVKFRS